MYIDPQARASLEIDKITALVARSCRCSLGTERIASLAPAADLDELKARRELFADVERYRDERGELPWSYRLSSVRALLADCKQSGMLTGAEIVCVRTLMQTAARVRTALAEARSEMPALGALMRELRDFGAELEALGCLDEAGRLYDHASERLRRARDSMRALRDAARRKGNEILSDPSLASMLQERVIALRHGRHAVLVRQESLGSFPGIVMDRSSSGSSVYMEPHALMRINNDFALAADDERTEESRILHRLTDRLLSREAAILDAESALGEIDMFYALSEKMHRDGWRMPLTAAAPFFDLRRARHPLLGDAAVPTDISCGEECRALVVTGPNTGGKTVALKTAGVCAALAWLGWPIPAEESSVVGTVADIYADIGDEQSIEQNLSTFSAHIKTINSVLARAGESSLVLLDELGAGTDPDEGAALGIAVLEHFRERGSLVLATTHHNPIKRYALSTDGVESASVEFDAATLSPTYRLRIGIPGRSNALLIAERLGAPRSVIERAREALHGKEVSMEDIIGELHEKRAAMERENASLDAMRAEIERTRERYERERRDLEQRRDKLLADADRKAAGIVANAEMSARSLLRTMDAESRAAADRKLQRSKKHFAKIKDQAEQREDERVQRDAPRDESPLAVGDAVVVLGTNVRSLLESIDGDQAEVSTGAARVTLPLKMLRRATGDEEKRDKKSARAERKSDITISLAGAAPSVRINMPKAPTGVPSSIMVRGMTTDEAMPMAEQYLDRAYRAGYGEVSIIHGRGEGILRREIHAMCNHLPYVASYRLGEPGEGGHGVTVIRFK